MDNVASLLDNIKILAFNKTHISLLNEMLEAHDHPKISYKLPKIGYIALLGDQPIAAGFLRRMEGDVLALFDGLTSNPAFGSIIRHEGLTLVVNRLIVDAKHLNIQAVIAFTKDKGVLSRAKSIGFIELDEKTISLNLAHK